MKHSTEILVELYKRGHYDKIPLGKYPNGDFFYMTDKQIRAVQLMSDDVTTNVGYGGSARSGKTIIEDTIILLDCLAYPGIGWGLGRRELTTLKRTTLLTLFGQFEFYGISENDYIYNQQLNKISLFNGSDIFLIDTAFKPSDPLNTRFGGLELTKCAIDESNETDITVVNKLFERTGWRLNAKYNLKRKLFECFNPSKNHVYNRFYEPFKNKKEPEHSKFIPALPADNPNPAVKEWIDDMMKTADEITIQRQIFGNFDYDDDPSALCSWDAILDLFTNNHVRAGLKRISADLAMQGRDKFIALLQTGGIISVIIDKDKSTAKEIEDSLTEKKKQHLVGNSNIVADSDGLGQYLSSYIKNIKTFHGGSNKMTKENQKIYYNLKTACAYKLAEKINNRELYISGCTKEQEERIKKEISMCLKRFKVDDDGKLRILPKEKMKEYLGHSPDYLDALIMLQYWDVANINIGSPIM